MSETKYTSDGKKVIVVGKINNTDYIVQEIYVTEDGSEIPSGEKFVTKNLLEEPAITWEQKRLIELKKQEKKSELVIEEINQKIKECHKKLDSISEVVKQALLTKEYINSEKFDCSILANYMCGNIKYILFAHYGDFEVRSMSDYLTQSNDYGRFESIRLATLLGQSNGDIQFRIERYSDGSGCCGQEVYPFNTMEDVKNKVYEIASNLIEKNQLSEKSYEQAISIGVCFTQEQTQKYLDSLIDNTRKNIDYQIKKQLDDYSDKLTLFTQLRKG